MLGNSEFDCELQSLLNIEVPLSLQITVDCQKASGNIHSHYIKYVPPNIHQETELLQGLLVVSGEARHKTEAILRTTTSHI